MKRTDNRWRVVFLLFAIFGLFVGRPKRLLAHVSMMSRQTSTLRSAIAYISQGDLYVRDLSRNSPPRRLTTDGLADTPIWSPSGKWIAFFQGRLYVIRRDGTGRHAFSDKSGKYAVRWSPKDELTFIDNNHNRIMAYQPQTHRLRCLVSGATPGLGGGAVGSINDFAWNSRGDALCFVTEQFGSRSRDGGRNRRQAIWRVDASGRHCRTLFRTRGQACLNLRGWSPDNRRILFWSEPYSEAADYIGGVPLDVDGLPLRDFPTDGNGSARLLMGDATVKRPDDDEVMCIDRSVAFDPTGRFVAVVVGSGRFEKRNPRWILLIDLRTGERRRLSPIGMHAMRPVWSEDGRQIAFCGGPQARPSYESDAPVADLASFVMDKNGENRRQVSSLSADGAIAFLGKDHVVFESEGKVVMASTMTKGHAPLEREIVPGIDEGIYGGYTWAYDSWAVWEHR